MLRDGIELPPNETGRTASPARPAEGPFTGAEAAPFNERAALARSDSRARVTPVLVPLSSRRFRTLFRPVRRTAPQALRPQRSVCR